ncbi:EAL domain-containing protein [Sphingobium boeckii]|uniref:EAL domain-containing protein (Putative c-di-GMP-specific phosphodiesterase class I)/CHASE2 domain-containing sensor protein n=1 Tax=Sphingobium boeckii TaxID=1082345 RepID=A0A7W9AKA6_9SPHN|nr:EAL domain-containing protein [Sphingobium boeckii]MBB5687239.1 EAL domain-containing protein (putative c-di-GMP-specific phosphodiesterase class I)/CHASE2 domain-containing sensor protein [Sphingobium boeckii]
MPFRRFSNKKSVRDNRAKILIWATLIGLICGVIDFGEPIENIWRSGRNVARSHPADQSIVVVGIDDRSLEGVDKWPWPRRYNAQMVDNLRAMGAKRIAFDYIFSSYSTSADDRIFEESLKKAKGTVILPVRFSIDPVSEKRVDVTAAPEFARHAKLANINVWRNPFGEVWEMYFGIKIDGRDYPSFSSLFSNKRGEAETLFPVDLSIDVKTIPVVSAIDVIHGTVSPDRIRGKDIIIGYASDQLGDIHMMAGRGLVPGVYFHAIGAQTLKQGIPVSPGWFPAFAAAFLLAGLHLFSKKRALSRLAALLGFLLPIGLPFFLDSRLIFAQFVPGTLLFIIAASAYAWSRFKQRGATTNAISGLPNLNALRDAPLAPSTSLVAARIQNFAEITSTLPQDMERILVEQIASRIALGADGSKIYQGDEGIFSWLVSNGPTTSLGDQLDALHALFRSPVIVGERHVDLAIAFGVDTASDRTLPNRLGSALVAADEAVEEGARWKEYDPAKLQDAEWKLSLLGRLDAAIDGGEIWVAYQPKMDMKTKAICGAEALARWSHPEKGEISPQDFVLAAEQHNRIEKLTNHVLNDAIRVAAEINRRGLDFDMAVNLSARVLDNPDLVSTIQSILARHGLEPRHLTLEVTESAAMTSSGRSIELLENMRALGIQISIDDYGTGFSTLEYLKKIPATEIKIDRSFVSAMDKSQSDKLMVNSTIALAHSLGRTVVAEGVEKEDTLRALEEMGCDRVQGYLIGRPMPYEKLSALIPTVKAIMVA